MEIQFTLSTIDQVARSFLAQAGLHRVFAFHAPMGTGKTTFIAALCRAVGVQTQPSSPTFSLVNEYRTSKNEKIFHFDFYRINKEEEALDMGIEEYFYSNNWCLLEWPNKVENLLPLKSVNITITLNSNQLRTIEVLNNE